MEETYDGPTLVLPAAPFSTGREVAAREPLAPAFSLAAERYLEQYGLTARFQKVQLDDGRQGLGYVRATHWNTAVPFDKLCNLSPPMRRDSEEFGGAAEAEAVEEEDDFRWGTFQWQPPRLRGTDFKACAGKLAKAAGVKVEQALAERAPMVLLDANGAEKKLAALEKDAGGDLEVIDLQCGCLVGLRSIDRVADVLTAKEGPLRKLLLRGNYVCAAGAARLAEGLVGSTACVGSLEVLSLPWNAIADEGAASLAGVLGKLKALLELDLGNNRIGDHGADCLASSVRRHATLKRLDLSGNHVRLHAAERLAAACGTTLSAAVRGGGAGKKKAAPSKKGKTVILRLDGNGLLLPQSKDRPVTAPALRAAISPLQTSDVGQPPAQAQAALAAAALRTKRRPSSAAALLAGHLRDAPSDTGRLSRPSSAASTIRSASNKRHSVACLVPAGCPSAPQSCSSRPASAAGSCRSSVSSQSTLRAGRPAAKARIHSAPRQRRESSKSLSSAASAARMRMDGNVPQPPRALGEPAHTWAGRPGLLEL
eukprot:TRINITY_DN91208_c0_g1_i1.p1 TRINITY_DN91208_c0_g1~~TRINITY_DN91208_c0_g1_i1.p1  ORF type:complete len:578 (-),score=122.53 TRINITY_DN91208_c0_g1_i1:50-1666(-)